MCYSGFYPDTASIYLNTSAKGIALVFWCSGFCSFSSINSRLLSQTEMIPRHINVNLHLCPLLWCLMWAAVHLLCASFPLIPSSPAGAEWAQGRATDTVCPGYLTNSRQFREPQLVSIITPNSLGDAETNPTKFKLKCSHTVQKTQYNYFTLGLQKYLRPPFPDQYWLGTFQPTKRKTYQYWYVWPNSW